MIRSPLARILAIAFVVLSFSMLVWGAPVEAGKNLLARGGTCSVGCTTGNQVVDILVRLKADIAIKLDLLALRCLLQHGTDPAGIVADIVVLINAAVVLILACLRTCLGLLNGKISSFVNLCVSIVIDIASHCGKWSDKPNFDGLLSACGGLLGTILGLIAGLLGGANLALLLKVKFNLCVGILGL
ncbi:hypothetical protein RhiXN_01711 [Rhizoctonia solani]|uniref:Transmembrane protein n=1 Tax=Rhizoctonia solani TaxID=456999 RepID=A0A8H8T240_9AGAM|nr:uncharacterized protein RhiXN_01711 [Rhizoctonia solani]QRW27116.1 hypothetical protein RhiXN_01711 [Rhizoctonia solani]